MIRSTLFSLFAVLVTFASAPPIAEANPNLARAAAARAANNVVNRNFNFNQNHGLNNAFRGNYGHYNNNAFLNRGYAYNQGYAYNTYSLNTYVEPVTFAYVQPQVQLLLAAPPPCPVQELRTVTYSAPAPTYAYSAPAPSYSYSAAPPPCPNANAFFQGNYGNYGNYGNNRGQHHGHHNNQGHHHPAPAPKK